MSWLHYFSETYFHYSVQPLILLLMGAIWDMHTSLASSLPGLTVFLTRLS